MLLYKGHFADTQRTVQTDGNRQWELSTEEICAFS